MSWARVQLGDSLWRVDGRLTFETVTGLLRDSGEAFGGGSGPLEIDLSGVEHADSAGIALLIEWLRRARKADREVHYRHMPRQMAEIARISDLERFLPGAGD